ncbi:protein kinase-like domain, Phloem protein 2-like protein [Artemisia annua]|uniref:Protein kinase-like domain, Phloem protein 2-like protein n=1 Tax=Artemisia annua TaxID=35608 RepID=A0A2U1KHR8_ARTAN|nr:protein kinase-like domain, Phloem protein 2-like protein [Artemisia annua]
MSSSGLRRLEDLLIPLEEIRLATKNFSEETLIGGDGLNRVYKGQFTERLQNYTAAVKRFSSYNYQKEGFFNELNVISRFHHENIISLIGYCNEDTKRIIVSEYAANGTLDTKRIIVSEYAANGTLGDHLEDPNKLLSLTWPQRLKICLGAAKAINYLHLGLKDCVVIHRDIKSDAIWLDENLEAKISSFEVSVVGDGNQQHIYERIAGTEYYIDPIYRESGILKKEADVYSFGVVMFELLTGTLARNEMKIGDDKPLPLINLVRRYYNIDGLDTLIDRQIRDQIVRRSLDTFKETAYRCISYNLNDRPSMDRIVKRITEALDIHNHAAASTIAIRCHLHQNLENPLIPLEEIRLATGNFSDESKIPNTRVYKGQLSGRWGNRTAAFQRHNPKYDEAEFRNELQMMSNLRHENIIQLIGYCDEEGEMIIIYDYAVNGSLESHLEDESQTRCLTWAQRLKICIGAARGLKHLQASHGENKILVHRNFNGGNILLDDNMEPLICGLGVSIVVNRNTGQVHSIPVGPDYYIDPIYRESGIIKSETDVYSLGVVLFEMLTGMLAYYGSEEPQFLINLVRRYSYDDGVVKLIDPHIKDQIDIHSFLIFKEIASKCISLNLKDRPSLNRIIKRIEEALRVQEQGDASTIATRSQLRRQDKKLEDFRIPLDEIRLATRDFSEKIGEGGFGVVYKGQSSKSWQNCTVAIKRLNPEGHQGNNEFKNELNTMFRFHHQNIINFLGFCDEDNEMIIVNEYVSNGSLEDYLADVLNKKRRSLTWVERLRICIGAAMGLDYLHWGLGENNRSDVYSLGVVLFEMLTGLLAYYEKAIEKGDEPQFLINLVRRYFDDGLDMLVDRSIKDEMDRRSFHTFKYVAYACISLNSNDRPTIDTIIDRLEEALEFQMLGENPCPLGEQLEPEATAKVTGDGSDRGSRENPCPLGEQLEPEATAKVTGDGSDRGSSVAGVSRSFESKGCRGCGVGSKATQEINDRHGLRVK